MSAAAATSNAEAAEAVPVKAGKKKLIVIAATVVLLLAVGGGAAVVIVKQRAAQAAAAAEGEDGAGDAKAPQEAPIPKADLKNAPAFVPLDMFTVNLADRDAERYAQVGITLELVDAKAGDLLKAYMPAIRNNILLALSAKQAGELMDHQGKLQLAAEIRAAAVKPLGYIVDVPRPAAAASAADGGHDAPKAKPAKPKAAAEDPDVPVRAVHFSNFIIQ
ncbi:MAG TPA: flagellar basal body-associated FliL family protein [Burkholderiaceae bacterium]|nr:flagellar basal body-associated FliL family protein [Burkholderiaceae bacterium]